MSKISKADEAQVLAYHLEGHSYRQISELMAEHHDVSINKDTIGKIIKESSLEGNDVAEIKRLDPSNYHELQMARLAIEHEKAQTARINAMNEAKTIELEMLMVRQNTQDDQSEKAELKKEKFLSKYNRLVQQVIRNSKDATWESETVKSFLDSATALQTAILKFCDRHFIDEDELAIYQNIEKIIKYFEGELEEQTGGFFSSDDIEIDFTKEQRREWREMVLDDFDTEFEEDEELEVDDDNEEDEDDNGDERDEDDDEVVKKPSKRKK